MIIVRICGGLGNQMFQYAIAKSLALKNNDIFKLDLSFFQRQSLRKYELNSFNIEENIASKEECEKLRGKERFFDKMLKKLKLPLVRPETYVQEKQKTLFEENFSQLSGDLYLDGYWQNEKYFSDIRGELLVDFIPAKNLSNEYQIYFTAIVNSKSVSLHVRRGDYINDAHTNSVHGVCGIDYYKKAVNCIRSHVTSPSFYIFSDDMAWCEENFDFVENKIFVKNTKSALEDLELMKHCDHNIIANSSFSWWGAWLNENAAKIVLSPKQWIKNNTQNLKWVPDSWTQL